MYKKLTIKKLNTKTVQIKKGPRAGSTADKYGVMFEEKDGEWFNAWCGAWNKSWKEGDTVIIFDSQWQSRQWQEKTYWDITPPNASDMLTMVLNLEARVKALESK